jgi:accessory gene regulator B
MSLTEKMAAKMGSNAKIFLNVDEDTEQIIMFAILWIIIFGLIFGVLYEALLFSVTSSILRKYSGGAHASSSSRCIIIGTSIACIAGVSIDYIFCKLNMSAVMPISIVFIIVAFIIVVRNVPVDSIKKPITNIEVKKQFKKKSIIVIFLFTVIILILFILSQKYSGLYYLKFIECISLGILWQTISLTKGGISLMNKVDFVLKCIIEGGGKYGE